MGVPLSRSLDQLYNHHTPIICALCCLLISLDVPFILAMILNLVFMPHLIRSDWSLWTSTTCSWRLHSSTLELVCNFGRV